MLYEVITVVGEPQILGQVKAAYRCATEEKTAGVVLNRLLHRTFRITSYNVCYTKLLRY